MILKDLFNLIVMSEYTICCPTLGSHTASNNSMRDDGLRYCKNAQFKIKISEMDLSKSLKFFDQK